jgi:hypothetical protein
MDYNLISIWIGLAGLTIQIATLIVIWIYTGSTRKIQRSQEKQIQSFDEQVKLLGKQVEQSAKQFQDTMRPWVQVRGFSLDPRGEHLQIRLRNHGKHPATCRVTLMHFRGKLLETDIDYQELRPSLISEYITVYPVDEVARSFEIFKEGEDKEIPFFIYRHLSGEIVVEYGVPQLNKEEFEFYFRAIIDLEVIRLRPTGHAVDFEARVHYAT